MLSGEPFIPETITVHLGPPDSDASNVVLDFMSYIKNVVSSEIYPTWPENSIRANIYVIVSFAMNRIYTEWYRSKGYDFDITASTQQDMKFINGREIFSNISLLVDELFNDYIKRQGSIEPMFTAFCNGTTVTCAGLSQWGTVTLANEGKTPYEILQSYYGDDIDIVKNTPVKTKLPSYPGTELAEGSVGNPVKTVQVYLNRISRSYPAIPKIPQIDGIFGLETENAAKEFQNIFELPSTGIVNQATWYKLSYIYTSVKRLSELNSEGLLFEDISLQFPEELKIGMQGPEISEIQYYLAVIGAYYDAVVPIDITGYFGEETEKSVKSFQKVFGLPQTGVVDQATWNDLVRAYQGIVESVPFYENSNVALYPGTILKEGTSGESVRILQEYLSYIHETYNNIPAVNNTGYFGPLTKQSVMAFQKEFGLPVNGVVGAATWDAIAGVYSDLRFGFDKRPYQNPGYTITAE